MFSRRTNARRSIILAAAVCAAVACSVPAALAQPSKDKKKQEELRPPVPTQTGDMPTHLWGLTALLVGSMVVLGVTLLPSKRGHQD
jgi:hypothetical protein